MRDVEVVDDWLDDGQSGRFNAATRHAATSEALPLLATYFATGRDTLAHDQILSKEAVDELGDLLEFVQIRVLLAAADRLEPVLRGILGRPSFQYHRRREESVGVIRGRLDTITYLRRRHEVQAPRRFPVLNVQRSHVLPENVLATWAALTVATALKRLPLRRIPAEAPERRRAERTAEALKRMTQHPAFADCTQPAQRMWRAAAHSVVADQVRSRIRSGHIPNAESYEALTDWVDDFETKDIALDPGAVDWVFYDESFDTKLFELWCLHRLIVALTDRLGEATTSRFLVDRARKPIAEWCIGGLLIEVWFQAGLATIDVGDPRWRYDPRVKNEDRPADEPEPAGTFGGVPDVTVVVQQQGQPRRPVILDPKLRQRRSVPGSEIYKIIGYFGNLPPDHPHRGAIIFHGPGAQRSYRISDGGSGEILAVAVDPLDANDSQVRFGDLADFVIAAVPPSAMSRALGPADPDNEESVEEWVDTVQEQAVVEMADAISPDSLERSRKALRANLLDTWDSLDGDTQRMLATAEHFGGGVTPDMDHSGPLLGLAAGCERLLRRYLTGLGVALPAKLTFGQLLRVADDACTNRSGNPSQPLRVALVGGGVDLNDFHALIGDLFSLNTDYRIPAAHADVLEEAQWFAGRGVILLGGKAALPRIVAVLGL